MFNKYILTIFAVILTVSVFAQNKNFEEALRETAEKYKAVGLAVVVVKNNKPVYSNAIGYKNLETKEALSTNNLFRIASISKSFTATALMQLVEKGMISLDDDFSKLVGFTVRNPYYPEKKITLEMILSHRSTLNDSNGYFDFNIIDSTKNKDWKKSYRNKEPGNYYEYCNLNFNLAGAALERLTGVRFDDYVSKQILQPLKLQANYNIDSLDATRFATLYEYRNGEFIPQPSAYASRSEEIKNYTLAKSTPIFSPTGGLKISANDLAKYMVMHMNYGKSGKTRIISEQSSKRMQRKLSDEEGYGLALFEADDVIDGVHLVGHTGDAYGLYSTMLFNPEKKFGFVVITNGCNNQRSGRYPALSKAVVNLLYKEFIK